MPHMMPMMWIFIFLSTFLSLFILMSLIYFFYLPKIPTNTSSHFKNINKWTWMW